MDIDLGSLCSPSVEAAFFFVVLKRRDTNVLFMALHMMSVRMTPEAPTRHPDTISTVFPIGKPANAAARPESALRNEMITGMSPPPIVMTRVMPNTREASVVITTPATPRPPSGEMQMKRMPRAATARMPALMKFLPGIEMFFLNIERPASLPHAIREPVKATAPMRIVRPRVICSEIISPF